MDETQQTDAIQALQSQVAQLQNQMNEVINYLNQLSGQLNADGVPVTPPNIQ